MLKLVNGKHISMDMLEKDLERDHILFSKPDPEIKKLVGNYFTSYLQMNIFANRYDKDSKDELEKYFTTKLKDIINYDFIVKYLPEVSEAADLINKVMKNNGHIVIVSDYDVDGVTSAVVSYKIIKEIFGYDNVEVFINKREYSNGINKKLTEMLIAYGKKKQIDLLFTSDHGSHDRTNLNIIKDELGCEIIVTDHHLFEEEEAPTDCSIFINPQKYDNYLKNITGANVAYFTLIASYFKYHKEIDNETIEKIYYLLTYVGMTVISDCMDLKSFVNRKIVIKALTDINNMKIKHDVFWSYVRKHLASSYIIDETVLSYNIIAKLNTPGRIGDPRLSFEVMTAESEDEIIRLFEELDSLNDKRKELQQKIKVKKDVEQYDNGIVKVVLAEGSDGTQGILANDIMYNENYKVVIYFTKNVNNNETILIGSGRAQDENLNLKDIITAVAEKSDIVIKHGGHAMAIGVKIKPDLKKFYDLLVNEVEKQKITKIENIYVEDYIFSVKKMLLHIFDIIEISPFGVGFEKPLFVSDFYIESYRLIKKKSNYYLTLKVKLDPHNKTAFTVLYSVKSKEVDYINEQLKKSKYTRIVYNLNITSYRNFNKILIQPVKLIFKEDYNGI